MNVFSEARRCGVFFLSPSERANAEKAAVGSAVFQVKLTGLKSKAAVLAELGKALNFPGYYGQNFDALNDCLTDPEIWPAKPCVLFIDGLQALQSTEPNTCATLLEIFQSAAEDGRTKGKPFWVLLDVAFSGISPFKA